MTPSVQAARRRLAVPGSIESPRAKLIYLYLRSCGNSTLEDLHEDLDIPIMSLYSLLDELEGRELVTRQGRFYRLVDDDTGTDRTDRA